jgi:hypothetical protein
MLTTPHHDMASHAQYTITLTCFLMLAPSLPPLLLGAYSPNSQLEQVRVEIDTNDLLCQMMKQASRIVAMSINAGLIEDSGLNKILRSESTAAMPPPLPKLAGLPRMSDAAGLDLLSKLAAERPIVSPHLSARPAPTYIIPCVLLEVARDANHDFDQYKIEEVAVEDEVENEEDDPYAFSPDQCAHIVDCVFGDLDDAMLVGPLTKKHRIY